MIPGSFESWYFIGAVGGKRVVCSLPGGLSFVELVDFGVCGGMYGLD